MGATAGHSRYLGLLPGTEGASFPFWSPDSRTVAFFSGGKLKKVPISGGPSIPLCDALSGRGGTWSPDNTIVFTPAANRPLHKVSSAGGTPTAITTLNKGENGHRWPSFLPDGRHFVYVAAIGGGGVSFPVTGSLRIGSLDSSETTILGPADSMGVYGSGYLLFVRGSSVMAQPFDPTLRQATGEVFPVLDQLSFLGPRCMRRFQSPTLAYLHTPAVFHNPLS